MKRPAHRERPEAASPEPPPASFARRWAWVPLLALTVTATVAGLRAGQWTDVAGWFNAVCSACIGLTFR